RGCTEKKIRIILTTLTARSRLAGATDKTVTDTNDRFDAIAAFIELLPQSTNVHVERAGVAIVTVTPDTIQQLLARHHSISAARQHRKQRELFVREFDLHAVARDTNIVKIDEQVI